MGSHRIVSHPLLCCCREELFDRFMNLHDIERAVEQPLVMAAALKHVDTPTALSMCSAVRGGLCAEESEEAMAASSHDHQRSTPSHVSPHHELYARALAPPMDDDQDALIVGQSRRPSRSPHREGRDRRGSWSGEAVWRGERPGQRGDAPRSALGPVAAACIDRERSGSSGWSPSREREWDTRLREDRREHKREYEREYRSDVLYAPPRYAAQHRSSLPQPQAVPRASSRQLGQYGQYWERPDEVKWEKSERLQRDGGNWREAASKRWADAAECVEWEEEEEERKEGHEHRRATYYDMCKHFTRGADGLQMPGWKKPW